MSTLNEISQMVITGQIRTIKAKVQQALDEGIGAQEILDGGLLPGINEIGEKFARNEVFVPNVLLAAKVMNMGVEVIQPLLAAGESTKLGTAVVGTVKGDLHDIGKIGIDEKILNKPGKLTPEEFEVMKTHSMLGAQILYDLDNFSEQPLLQTAYEIARWHHERWDGRGYPDGLKGDEIPISAQLVSLADVYDALTSERCYKKAFSHEKAMQMILNGECGAFNPLLLQCLTNIQSDLKEELKQHN